MEASEQKVYEGGQDGNDNICRREWSRRPLLDAVRLSDACLRLAASGNRSRSGFVSTGMEVGDPGTEEVGDDVGGLSHKSQGLLEPRLQKVFNFEWCEEQYEVLKYFDAKVPRQLESNVNIIRTEESSLLVRGTKRVRREEIIPDTSPGDWEAPSLPSSGELPRHYYVPWPALTHKLPFPGDSGYNLAERAVATLTDYRIQRQSDDSIELGLRITAHVHMNKTSLTVHPVTQVWGILKCREGENFDAGAATDVAVVHQLQRRLCPYMPVPIGLSHGFATMMVYCGHWWVLLLIGADTFIDLVAEKVRCVSESIEDGYLEASKIMDEYAKSFDDVTCEGVSLCAMDSLDAVVPLQAWSNVKKYMFTCIFHSLMCRLSVEGERSSMGKVAKIDGGSQILHLACASFQSVERVLWNTRVDISGPLQPDDLSCGAFGLATVWKLAVAGGVAEMEGKIRNSLKGRCNNGDKRRHVVRFMRIPNYYDRAFVAYVVREFDLFVRKEVIRGSLKNAPELD